MKTTKSQEKFDVLNRFNLFLTTIHKTQTELANIIGVPQPYISKIKKGELNIEPYINTFYRLGLNLNWLYTGYGEMYRKELSNLLNVVELADIEVNKIENYIEDEFSDVISFGKMSKVSKSVVLLNIFDEYIGSTNPDYINIVSFGINLLDYSLIDKFKYCVDLNREDENKLGIIYKYKENEYYISFKSDNKDYKEDYELIVKNAKDISHLHFILNKDF